MIYVKPDRRLTPLLRAAFGAAAMTLAVTGAAAQGQGVPQNLPTVKLSVGMHQIQAMVANTPSQRQTGLMFRKDMAQHEGMLFIFEQPTQQCFWMRNTLLPLSIAFISDDGTVVNTDEMKPQTDDSHCSAKPVRFVLEMNQGWFDKKGVKSGAKITGAPFTTK